MSELHPSTVLDAQGTDVPGETLDAGQAMERAWITRKLAELFEIDAPPSAVIYVCDPSEATPALDPHYVFSEDLIRKLQIWEGGFACRNLLLTGPTGAGKSSVFEQFCARVGLDLYRYACHSKTEFGELCGQTEILEDGSTKFVLGPLPMAMMTGAILLLDELNFLHPGNIGALNGILDGAPLLIPATGQMIYPHPRFRVAGTCNELSQDATAASFRGTQRMNLAFVQRFLVAEVDYLTEIMEAKAINRSCPGLPGPLIQRMITLANEVRNGFKQNTLNTTISTRILIRWGRIAEMRLEVIQKALVSSKPLDELEWQLRLVLLDGVTKDDQHGVIQIFQRVFTGLTLDAFTSTPVSMGTSPGVPVVPAYRMRFAINPARPEDKNPSEVKVAFYACLEAVDPNGESHNAYGIIFPEKSSRSRLKATGVGQQGASEAALAFNQKISDSYEDVLSGGTLDVPANESPDLFMKRLISDLKLMVQGTPELRVVDEHFRSVLNAIASGYNALNLGSRSPLNGSMSLAKP